MSPMLAHVGPMLALCWPNLALSCPYVGPMFAYMSALCWPYVGLTWPYLAPMLALCSPTCTLSCPMLTLCWPQFPLSCPYVDPVVAYVGLGNALPHSSDRNGGGDDGVTTGWERGEDDQVGGWGGSPYNLRLPTEGLRQGHGPVAGARRGTSFGSERSQSCRS